jgi:hypothetical protein
MPAVKTRLRRARLRLRDLLDDYFRSPNSLSNPNDCQEFYGLHRESEVHWEIQIVGALEASAAIMTTAYLLFVGEPPPLFLPVLKLLKNAGCEVRHPAGCSVALFTIKRQEGAIVLSKTMLPAEALGTLFPKLAQPRFLSIFQSKKVVGGYQLCCRDSPLRERRRFILAILPSCCSALSAVVGSDDMLARLVYLMLTFGHEYVDRGIEFYETKYRQQQLQWVTKQAAALRMQLVPLTTVTHKVSGEQLTAFYAVSGA